jgi:hypothetical protein
VCLGEAPRARNRALPHRRHQIKVTGLHQTAFLRFLARVDSLAPREAFCALGLNFIAVDRLEHPPPTSSPACASGPADFGHHRRRAVPRRDRKDLPKPTPPFAGPPSLPVSRAALFTFAGTVQKGGTSGKKK